MTLGKSIAGGVPLGAYGMTEAVADILQRPERAVRREGGHHDRRYAVPRFGVEGRRPGKAVGAVHPPTMPTLHTQVLGPTVVEKAIRDAGLPWTTHRFSRLR